MRTLVVDDNVDSAESLAEVLTLEGHEAEVRFGGAKAVADDRSEAMITLRKPFDIPRRSR